MAHATGTLSASCPGSRGTELVYISMSTLRDTLATARLYLCTDARQNRGDFREFLHRAYTGGVDIIQLRDKNIDVATELQHLAILREVAEEHGRLWSVNDRADLAVLAQAPVLHVGQTDLPPADAHSVSPHSLLGLSSHTPEQASAAARDTSVDYFCVGPLWATPTKPGRAAVGLSLVSHAASLHSTTPWFAIGGIDLGNIRQVVAAGATRVVVVRAITEANNPTEAAQALLAALPPITG